ncbi:MAG: hypothetical protein WCS42_20605 [Verrucomicrobiota bacterium]
MKPTFMKVACDKIIPALIFLSGLALVGGCSTFDFESHSAQPWNHPTKYEVERATTVNQTFGYPPTNPIENYP